MDHPAVPQSPADPHGNGRVFVAGPKPEQADATLLLIHGRGAAAENMLALYRELALPTIAAIAPQAADNVWYPQSFLAPIAANQPYLDSALRRIESLISQLVARGIKSDHIVLLGFSQGACLATEFAARHTRPYGGIIGLTGGLIGPEGTPRDYRGSLAGTPVFLGTSDPDAHVPFARVEETKVVLERLGAAVELRRYPGMGHTVNDDELDAVRALLQRFTPS
jgi:predicted esterase